MLVDNGDDRGAVRLHDDRSGPARTEIRVAVWVVHHRGAGRDAGHGASLEEAALASAVEVHREVGRAVADVLHDERRLPPVRTAEHLRDVRQVDGRGGLGRREGRLVRGRCGERDDRDHHADDAPCKHRAQAIALPGHPPPYGNVTEPTKCQLPSITWAYEIRVALVSPSASNDHVPRSPTKLR